MRRLHQIASAVPSFSRADSLSLPKVLAPSALRVPSDGKDGKDGLVKRFGTFSGFGPSSLFGAPAPAAPESLAAKRFTLPGLFESPLPGLSRTNSECSSVSAYTVTGPTPPSAWLVMEQDSTPPPPSPPPPPPLPSLPSDSSRAVAVAYADTTTAEASKGEAGDVFGFLSPQTVGRDRGAAQATSAWSAPRNFQSAMAAFDDAMAEARSGATAEPPELAAEKALWGAGTAQGGPPPPPPPPPPPTSA